MKAFKKIKWFYLKLITAHSGISSKRFISLNAFLFLCIYALVGLFDIRISLNSDVIYTLGALILGDSALSSFDKFKSKLPDAAKNILDKAESEDNEN